MVTWQSRREVKLHLVEAEQVVVLVALNNLKQNNGGHW